MVVEIQIDLSVPVVEVQVQEFVDTGDSWNSDGMFTNEVFATDYFSNDYFF